ncbi:hypothetical protein BH09MYX1_BH09MYX1_61320 [soil metagenome]
MAEIAPLTPLRYDLSRLPAGLGSVVAPPYDVIDDTLRAELAAPGKNPARKGRKLARVLRRVYLRP